MADQKTNRERDLSKVRLRHLFQAAALAEKRGKNFYERLAEKAVRPEVKELCLALAAAEARHQKVIEEALSQWIPLPAGEKDLEPIHEEMEAAGIFAGPPAADAGEDAMARYAIAQEIKMAGFYETFEKSRHDVWKKMNLHGLVIAERSHADSLKRVYPKCGF